MRRILASYRYHPLNPQDTSVASSIHTRLYTMAEDDDDQAYSMLVHRKVEVRTLISPLYLSLSLSLSLCVCLFSVDGDR